MQMRVVLDTSALLGSYRHELVFAAHEGYYALVWSSFIIAEVVRIRTELAIKHQQDRTTYRARINACIRELSPIAEFVDYTLLEGGNYQQWLQDADDEPILATALVGRAHSVVSLNTKDFPPMGIFAGVRYLTPRQFLDELYSQHPDKNLPEDFADSGFRVP